MNIISQLKGYEKTIKHLSANAWDFLCTCKVVIKRVPSSQEMVEKSLENIRANIKTYETIEFSEKTFEDPSLEKEIIVGLLFDEHKGIKSINVDMNSFLPYIYQLQQ